MQERLSDSTRQQCRRVLNCQNIYLRQYRDCIATGSIPRHESRTPCQAFGTLSYRKHRKQYVFIYLIYFFGPIKKFSNKITALIRVSLLIMQNMREHFCEYILCFSPIHILTFQYFTFQVQKYHKEILDDLVTNLTSNQWRVRMSCCNALADLLRSVNYFYRDYFVETYKIQKNITDNMMAGCITRSQHKLKRSGEFQNKLG